MTVRDMPKKDIMISVSGLLRVYTMGIYQRVFVFSFILLQTAQKHIAILKTQPHMACAKIYIRTIDIFSALARLKHGNQGNKY